MATIEQTREHQISPEKLRTALDVLIRDKGDGATSAELYKPGDSAAPLEHSYYVVTRQTAETGPPNYSWQRITPLVGTSKVELSFDDDAVISTQSDIVWGSEAKKEARALAPDELQDLFDKVTDPTLEPRQQAIANHKNLHKQQSWLGRIMAKVRQTDKSKYV
jgi:hypothetical protein